MMLGMNFILIHILKQTFMLMFCVMDQGFVSLYTGRDGIQFTFYSLSLA